MIVVFDIQRVPAPAVKPRLPAAHGRFQLPQGEGTPDIVRHEAVGCHMLEMDEHVQHPVIAADEAQRLFRRHPGRLPDGDAVIFVRHMAELGEVFMEPGAVGIVAQPLRGGHQKIVGQPLRLGDEGDDVLSKAVHPQLQPEAVDPLHLLAHRGVLHIQIRLLLGKQMQVILPAHLVVFPCLALEKTVPVVGMFSVFPGGTPDVVVRIRLLPPPGGLEPRVLVGGVVHHEIHNDLHAPAMRLVQQCFELLQGAVFRVYIAIIRHVVAVIRVGGRIQRGEPNALAPEALDIVELFENALQIADPVAAAIHEAPGPYLIKRHVFIPFRHDRDLPSRILTIL